MHTSALPAPPAAPAGGPGRNDSLLPFCEQPIRLVAVAGDPDDDAPWRVLSLPCEHASGTDDGAHEREQLLIALAGALGGLTDSADCESVMRRLIDDIVNVSSHLVLAWVWIGPADAEVITPLCVAGAASAFGQMLQIARSQATTHCPVFQSLQLRRISYMPISPRSPYKPWRRAAQQYGFEEMLAVPFDLGAIGQHGVAVFYSDERGYFKHIGTQPFQALAKLAQVAVHQAHLVTRLQLQSSTDPLCATLNRHALEKILQQEFSRARSSGEGFGLILLDLDRFKLINDSYGHPAGDTVLRETASLLRRHVRETDIVGRWGGEEFLIILPRQGIDQVQCTAERLRAAIESACVRHEGRCIQFTASFGITTWSGQACTPERLISRLDSFLYDAKRMGRNQVRGADGRGSETLSLGAQIQAALDAQRIRAAYQPLVDLRSGAVVAQEALARLVTADGQVIAAGEFIGAAHRLRMEWRIDEAVSRQALMHCLRSVQAGQPMQRHLINCSADFLARPGCIDALLQAAERNCTACADLLQGRHKPVIIEVTERQLLGDPAKTRQLLQPLLDFGFELAVDDFGSGYSSFLYLLDLPVRYLKIEGELVRRAVADARARTMVESIQSMASRLDIRTIAEGIEDQATCALMRDLGIDWGQGYLWGHPQIG
ncbi:EAL domain-containing protein [Thiomonas sp.]|jgi:diguanylate cyclase (GGDEF)-like protein|uniref:putative bifunctional diguanylate cyclase/phosphodiesterase n=1 Tax=Thiomonas sp. TaxID=2047785 RepID=UPI00261A6268|nr:EAL domain-containing protein [Thiomonas sp.]